VLGWRLLLTQRVGLVALFWVAAVREAFDRLLPVANIGGQIVGIRLLVVRGVDPVVASSSVIIELLVTLSGLLLFGLLGLVCVSAARGAPVLTADTMTGLAVVLAVIVAVTVLLRTGHLFDRLRRVLEHTLGGRLQSLGLSVRLASLDAAVRGLLASPGRLAAAVAWQLSGLIAGSAETWLALRWLGHPVGIAAAIGLESLTQATRHLVFFIPAGLGVQEAGLVAVGQLLGLESGVALALSLAKRMRELLFGVPAIIAWYCLEERGHLQQSR